MTPNHARLTLSIDIGATSIKLILLDCHGNKASRYVNTLTPKPATVNSIYQCLYASIRSLNAHFDRVSVGFPGVIHHGVIKTAPNLDSSWLGINLQLELQDMLRRPTRVANDADLHGHGIICGQGVEMVITLGTGMGSALFCDGNLFPNLELGHHIFYDNLTYEQCIGKFALKQQGVDVWQKNLQRAMTHWQQMFNYDQLYLGGGHAKLVRFKLPDSVKISSNIEGILGGLKLWQD